MLGPLLEVEMSKKCTPLWREAHFEVKMYKTHHSWKLRCRKSVRRCGKSTFRSQNVQSTPLPDHFWKLRCRKSVRRCGAKHISWVKMCKAHHVPTTFGGSNVVSRGRRKGLCILSKVSKKVSFFLIAQRRSVKLPYRSRLVCWAGKMVDRQLDR